MFARREEWMGEKALVVDDDVSIRLLLTRVLEREDFKVETARDGIEAIEKLSSDRFDIVFLDLMMPRIDGLGVLRHLRKNSPDVLQSVVVMTAFHKVADEVTSGDGEVGKIVDKPFDITDLVTHARELARQKDVPADLPGPS